MPDFLYVGDEPREFAAPVGLVEPGQLVAADVNPNPALFDLATEPSSPAAPAEPAEEA